MKAAKSDQDIVQDLIYGKESGLTAVYNKYSERIYNLSFLLLKDSGWSEDIVQEVFVKLWNSRATLYAQSDIWPYLYALTKRQSLNKLRGIKRSKKAFESLLFTINKYSETPESIFEKKEINEELTICFSRLPRQQERVFTLSRIDGLSHQEIAEKLNISQNTVKNHMVKALRYLRRVVVSKKIYLLIFYVIYTN